VVSHAQLLPPVARLFRQEPNASSGPWRVNGNAWPAGEHKALASQFMAVMKDTIACWITPKAGE